MLRRNFLRNAAFTLPVALVAPNALLANEQEAPQETDVIFIGAQDNQPNALPNETLVLSEARDIVCNNKGFELSDPNGNRYQTRKIVFAKSFTFCDTQARVHVQSSEAQSTTFSIKRNGRQSAVCWVASEGVHAQQVLPAFLGSPKAAILCMV